MYIHFNELKKELNRVLIGLSFDEHKANLCAKIFAENSLDGVHSHGLNRFPGFVSAVKEKLINPGAEPELIESHHALETWEGNLGPGMYNASLSMSRAIEIASLYGIGCVVIKNTNHWMRGGNYGWQAANAGYIGFCFTNTIANVTPWGGTDPRLGNNPVVIAVPKKDGHVVLDMAVSQYSFGKLQEFKVRGEILPVFGGYDLKGQLSNDPGKIIESQRGLPIGFWKGSGLSLMVDLLLTALSGGRSTAEITRSKNESGVSQCFICIKQPQLHDSLINEIIRFTKTSSLPTDSTKVYYPGEKTLSRRKEHTAKGIPVNEKVWQQVLNL